MFVVALSTGQDPTTLKGNWALLSPPEILWATLLGISHARPSAACASADSLWRSELGWRFTFARLPLVGYEVGVVVVSWHAVNDMCLDIEKGFSRSSVTNMDSGGALCCDETSRMVTSAHNSGDGKSGV